MISTNFTMMFMACLMVVMLHSSHAFNVYTNEIKTGQRATLCGDTFVVAWKHVCRFKQNRADQQRRKRAKRSIEEFVKPRTMDLVSQKGALSFLKSRNRRQVLLGGTDNADEECCKESCSYAEIAEYDC